MFERLDSKKSLLNSVLMGLIIIGITLTILFLSSKPLYSGVNSVFSSQNCQKTLSLADFLYNQGKINQFKELFDGSCEKISKEYISSKKNLLSKFSYCEDLTEEILNQKDFLLSRSEFCIPCFEIESSKDLALKNSDVNLQTNDVLEFLSLEIKQGEEKKLEIYIYGDEEKKINFKLIDIEKSTCNS